LAEASETSYTVSGRYGGASADERRAGRREQLVDAAFELLGRGGWRETTVRGVCEEAGLNARYFYESFTHLDELVGAVFEREVGRATAGILEAFDAAPDDARAKARAVIEACVEHLTADRRRTRILFSEALGDDALARRRVDTMHAVGHLIATTARQFYGREDDQDPIAELAGAFLIGGLVETIIAWLDGRLKLERAQLIDDLTDLWVVSGEGALAIADRRATGQASGRTQR
jgi:AcrR family transcriptional regulator